MKDKLADTSDKIEEIDLVLTRRAAMGGVAIVTAAVVAGPLDAKAQVPASSPSVPGRTLMIKPVVNGRSISVSIDPRTSLLDL